MAEIAMRNAFIITIVLLLSVAAVFPALAGPTLSIPAPSGLEICKSTGFLKSLAAPRLRLSVGFVTEFDNKAMNSGADPELRAFAMVLLPEDEHTLTDAEFSVIVADVDKCLGDSDLNRKAPLLYDDKMAVTAEINKPVNVGRMFCRKDCAGWLILLNAKAGMEVRPYWVNIVVMRIHGKALFAYRYDIYPGDGQTKAAAKLGEDWAEAILKANP